jgi:hypothetical protein
MISLPEFYDRTKEEHPRLVFRDLGINIVVFYGIGRNKRRGLHSTWVLYHRVLL